MSYPRINCDGTLAQTPAIIGLKPSFLYLKTPVSLKTPVFAYAFLWKSQKAGFPHQAWLISKKVKR